MSVHHLRSSAAIAFSFLVDGDATELDGVDGKSQLIVKALTSIHDALVSSAIFSYNGVDLVHLPGGTESG
jgi:hypothetical protein